MPLITVTIPHRLGAETAKRRIQTRLDEARHKVERIASEVEDRWNGDVLVFRVRALGQSVSGEAAVGDTEVRIEIELPALFGWAAGKLTQRIDVEAQRLIERPD